eukprot:46527-Eustigmatos_ZCMA.PRE.1
MVRVGAVCIRRLSKNTTFVYLFDPCESTHSRVPDMSLLRQVARLAGRLTCHLRTAAPPCLLACCL